MIHPVTQWLFGRPRAAQGEVLAALDIGSSKIACFIARADGDGPPRVIGIGHQLAEGMRNGAVVNIEALQQAISSTVATAEHMSGETIQRVIVNISGAQLVSQTATIELPLHGREVTDSDLHRIMAQGHIMAPEDAQGHALELIHVLPVGYALDHQKGIREPVGMIGHMLQAQIHLISAAFGPVRTLATAIARCHLDVEKLVAAPYASGLACLVEDEMDLGSLIIDMGAGTTSFAVFFEGHAVYTDGIPIGGAHVTSDIARGLTTSLVHAERLKTLYGNALSGAMDSREIIDVPQIGEEAPEHANHIPKSQLVGIIQPRLEEIFELVRSRLEKSGFSDIAGRRVVLTGGASQLPGVRELAQKVLDKQVRLGRPLRVARTSPSGGRSKGASLTGLAEATSGPAFATTAGLLAAALQPEMAAPGRFGELVSSGAMLSRIGQWIRQNM
ncbi:MAG: cell division protein FtsA [Alphaproteobacteria bacterium]|nr:cell division protein FtsA [Alphaproteobacteria bacterium]